MLLPSLQLVMKKNIYCAIVSAPLLLSSPSCFISPQSQSVLQGFQSSRIQTSKGDGWTVVLRAQLTASPFSLAREKQLLEGESIFISSRPDGSRIDIKGDSARGKGMELRGAGTGRGHWVNQIQESRAEQKEIERS